MNQSGYRSFLFGLFAASPERRQFILWQWLQIYAAQNQHKEKCFWTGFVELLLYGPCNFSMESSKFFILGPLLPVLYDWLTGEERHYLAHTLFAQRRTLFSQVRVLPHGLVQLSGICYQPEQGIDGVWRRQWIRDIAQWLAYDEKTQMPLQIFMDAIHNIALQRGDVWLIQLYATLTGHGLLEYLPCWGHGIHDAVVPSLLGCGGEETN